MIVWGFPTKLQALQVLPSRARDRALPLTFATVFAVRVGMAEPTPLPSPPLPNLAARPEASCPVPARGGVEPAADQGPGRAVHAHRGAVEGV